MERGDIPAVFHLLNKYLKRFDLAPLFQSQEEIEWWLIPRDNIVTTYVVEVTTSEPWRCQISLSLCAGSRDGESD